MHPRLPAIACLILGGVTALGFAPWELVPIALAAVAVWLRLVHGAPTWRAALWRGWLFGVGHFTVSNAWIQHAFDFQDKMPPVLGYGAVVALALYLAVYPMAAAGLAWRFGRTGAQPGLAYALVAGAAWIATEWLRAVVFTGYAWNPLAVMWVPVQPVAGLAAWLGTYALSGLTVTLAGALSALPARRAVRIGVVGGGAALIVLAQALSYQEYASRPYVADDAPRVRIVQPGIGQDARGEEDQAAMLRALIANSGRPGPAPRLVLWPEGVLRDYVEDGYPGYIYAWQALDAPALRQRLASLLGPDDILLFGGNALQFDRAGRVTTATNSLFALGPDARLTGRYDKAHLVPYGEYLPMRWLLEPLGLARLVPGDIDFRPGQGAHGIPTGRFGLVGLQICYEIIFSGAVVERSRRPAILFNPSTDAWFGPSGPPQHWAQARLRAIEEGLPVLRATPTGISGAIAADGAVLATVRGHGAGAVELPLPAAGAATVFARVGNWLALATALLLAAGAVALRRRRR